jgi:ribosomal protein L34
MHDAVQTPTIGTSSLQRTFTLALGPPLLGDSLLRYQPAGYSTSLFSLNSFASFRSSSRPHAIQMGFVARMASLSGPKVRENEEILEEFDSIKIVDGQASYLANSAIVPGKTYLTTAVIYPCENVMILSYR